MRTNRTKIGWAIAVAIAAGIVIPVLWGEPRSVSGQDGGDYWRNTIYDFQTLITGLAAVLAAAFTVGKMQQTIDVMERTDRESDRRHRELVGLTRRPDRLRLQRAVFPQLQDLQEISSRFVDFENIRETMRPDQGSPDLSWLRQVTERHRVDFEELDKILHRRQFLDGVNLFDGMTTRYLDELEAACKAAVGAIQDHQSYLLSDDYDEDMYYIARMDDEFPYVESAIIRTVRFLRDFIVYLGQYAEEAADL
ncbi:hypothetical protein [Rhizobium sp. BK377]|uniref:hypothetical protein n=1 Tax=Rhizobium sp. BK377 TaxID=2587058 RepID=UPI00161E7727|nr:hypothetical protein [Rhizobium sp. BK377]MBB3462004.1 hypothetical protein [Rhizobium sp. BK377]